MIGQRLLDLRGEASLKIRATAKPIITNTPKITSARFAGRDYLRVQRPKCGAVIVFMESQQPSKLRAATPY